MKRIQHLPSPGHPPSNGDGLRSARRQPARPNGSVSVAQFKRLSDRVEQMEGELDQIKTAWNRMGTSREQIEKNGADLAVQFQRIAAMQAEIDLLKAREKALQAEIDHLRAARS